MRLTIEVHSKKRTYLQFMVFDRSLSSMLLKSKRSKKVYAICQIQLFHASVLPTSVVQSKFCWLFEKIPGTELCLFDIFQIAEPSEGLKIRGGRLVMG